MKKKRGKKRRSSSRASKRRTVKKNPRRGRRGRASSRRRRRNPGLVTARWVDSKGRAKVKDVTAAQYGRLQRAGARKLEILHYREDPKLATQTIYAGEPGRKGAAAGAARLRARRHEEKQLAAAAAAAAGGGVAKKRGGKKAGGKKAGGKKAGGKKAGGKKASSRPKSGKRGKAKRKYNLGPHDSKRAARPYRGKKSTKRVTLRRGRRMPAWKRRKLISTGFLGSKGEVNPRRRRGRGRRRRNPFGMAQGFLGRLQSSIQGYWQDRAAGQPAYVLVAQGIVGGAVASVGPAMIEQYLGWIAPRWIRNSGLSGVGLTFLSGAAATAVGGAVEYSRLGRMIPFGLARGLGFGMGVGALTATVSRALMELAPAVAAMLQVSDPVKTYARSGSAGMGDWLELKGMGGGMRGLGSVTDAEALVAGESFARSVNQFDGVGDWMELKGLGQGPVGIGYPGQYGGSPAARFRADSLNYTNISGLGDNRIPIQDIRAPGQLLGMRGMGDWVEMMPNTDLAMQAFQPALETF